MAVRKADIAPRKRLHARRLYEDTTTPATRIAAGLGISPRTLAIWARDWGWAPRLRSRRGAAAAGTPAPDSPVLDDGAAPDTVPSSPSELPAAVAGDTTAVPGDAVDPALQVERSVERELAAIEAILARLGEGEERAVLAERTARTLASLTRTLAAVRRLRAAPAEGAEAAEVNAAEVSADDDMPRDIDEFRRELARRIDAFVAGGADAEISRERGE